MQFLYKIIAELNKNLYTKVNKYNLTKLCHFAEAQKFHVFIMQVV